MNTLEEKLQKDLMEAIKSRDELRADTIRNIKTSIMELKTAKNGNKNPDDKDIIKIIQKLAKSRLETCEIYRVNHRPELADKEIREYRVLSEYLPKMLTVDEVEKIVDQVISDFSVTDMSGMGKVMGYINKTYTGQVDGAMASQIVKEKLTKK
jgi:uncharacterized protein YqeY